MSYPTAASPQELHEAPSRRAAPRRARWCWSDSLAFRVSRQIARLVAGWLGLLILLTSCSSRLAPVPTASPAAAQTSPISTQPTLVPAPPEQPTPAASPPALAPLTSSVPPRPTSDVQRLARLSGRIFFLRAHTPNESNQVYQVSQGIVTPLALVGGGITTSPDGRFLIALGDYNRDEHTYRYRMLDTTTGALTNLPVRGGQLPADLVMAADGIHVALNYRCDLTDFRAITGTITEVAALMPTDVKDAHACQPGSVDTVAYTWLPDNDHLLLMVQGPTRGLVERDLNGQERMLSAANWTDVRIRADGAFIIGIQYQDGKQTVWVLERSTGVAEQILIPGMQVSQAILSPDGRYIIFSAHHTFEEPGQCLYLYDLQQRDEAPVCLMQGYRVLAWLPT